MSHCAQVMDLLLAESQSIRVSHDKRQGPVCMCLLTSLYFSLPVWMYACLHVCPCTACVPGACRGWKDLLEMELQMGAGD